MIKKSKQIIWGLILLLLFLPALLFADLSKLNRGGIYNDNLVLLLNSGLAHCETSVIKYILWTNDCSELETLNNIVESSNYDWQKEVVSDFSGQIIYKFTAEQRMDKEREKLIPKQLNDLEKQIRQRKVLLFFQQEIKEVIDIKKYMTSNKAEDMMNIIETETLRSMTGYSKNIGKAMQSGRADINIQILTNKHRDRGKTVVAIPALLEDF